MYVGGRHNERNKSAIWTVRVPQFLSYVVSDYSTSHFISPTQSAHNLNPWPYSKSVLFGHFKFTEMQLQLYCKASYFKERCSIFMWNPKSFRLIVVAVIYCATFPEPHTVRSPVGYFAHARYFVWKAPGIKMWIHSAAARQSRGGEYLQSHCVGQWMEMQSNHFPAMIIISLHTKRRLGRRGWIARNRNTFRRQRTNGLPFITSYCALALSSQHINCYYCTPPRSNCPRRRRPHSLQTFRCFGLAVRKTGWREYLHQIFLYLLRDGTLKCQQTQNMLQDPPQGDDNLHPLQIVTGAFLWTSISPF